MEKGDIKLTDIKRILLGEAPPEYMIEVFGRTLMIYIILLILLRLLGKRMNGQLSLIEMAVMITLGAIVSAPMQVPDRGVLIALVVLICALAFQRGINWLSFKKQKIEYIVQGKLRVLVKDGVLQLDNLKQEAVTKQQLFSVLRGEQIYNLGKVQRVYLEACGLFSIYQYKDKKMGLPLFPGRDQNIFNRDGTKPTTYACCNCGTTSDDDHELCPHCNEKEWIRAI